MNTIVQNAQPPRTAGNETSNRRIILVILAILLGGLVIIAAVLIAAISLFTINEVEVTAGGQQSPVVMGVGPGISVQDALASTLDQPLLVNGFLYVSADGVVYLTDALAESYPPSIDVARSLRVEGIDADVLSGLDSAGGIAWSDRSTQLAGDVDGNTLTISGTIQP